MKIEVTKPTSKNPNPAKGLLKLRKAIDIENAIKQSTDYLYKIDGELTEKQYDKIAILRQIINEEFIGKKKLISSQAIYDILKEIL